MMYYTTSILFFLLILLCACTPQNTTQKDSAKSASTAITKKVDPLIGNKPKVKNNLSDDALFLSPQSVSANKGEEVCVPITVRQFKDIVSMQYSINWNPKELNFLKIKDIKLQDLQERNFGQHIKDQGKLTFSWFDQSLRGISLPDKTSIYELCFEAIGKGKAKIIFSQDPVVVEITAVNAKFLKFLSEPGYVTIN